MNARLGMKRSTGALPRPQARTCLPKRGNSIHPHSLVAYMRGAVGRLPVPHCEAVPQVGLKKRPIALDRATTALVDSRIPDHVRSGESRYLLRIWPAPPARAIG